MKKFKIFIPIFKFVILVKKQNKSEILRNFYFLNFEEEKNKNIIEMSSFLVVVFIFNQTFTYKQLRDEGGAGNKLKGMTSEEKVEEIIRMKKKIGNFKANQSFHVICFKQ